MHTALILLTHIRSYALPDMWTVTFLPSSNIITHAQNQLQISLLTQYHFFHPSSLKLGPIMTPEKDYCLLTCGQ